MPDIGDFMRRSAKIAIAAPGTPGDFRRSPRSGYKIARCVTGLRWSVLILTCVAGAVQRGGTGEVKFEREARSLGSGRERLHFENGSAFANMRISAWIFFLQVRFQASKGSLFGNILFNQYSLDKFNYKSFWKQSVSIYLKVTRF